MKVRFSLLIVGIFIVANLSVTLYAKNGAAASIPTLVEALSNGATFEEREKAAQSLGKTGSKEVVNPLVTAFVMESNPNVRIAIIEALGALGAISALPEIVKGIKDDDKDVVAAAVKVKEKLIADFLVSLHKDFAKKTYHFMIDDLVCAKKDLNKDKLTKYYQNDVLTELLEYKNFQVGTEFDMDEDASDGAAASPAGDTGGSAEGTIELALKGDISEIKNMNRPGEFEVQVELSYTILLMPEEIELVTTPLFKGSAIGDPEKDELVTIQEKAVKDTVKKAMDPIKTIIVDGPPPKKK